MIGKPNWFRRRKYGGWGVFPKTWQGWAYIALVLIPFAIFQALPYWSSETRTIITIAWALFLVIDLGDVMIRMNKDEREKMHEAIAERNALWIVVLVLVIGVFYQLVTSALTQHIRIDGWIIIALFFGVAVKAITNLYLEKKN